MSANTDYNKIEKVLSKIPGKELKEFVRFYALTHDDLATALVEKYWKPERGNWKEVVEACFAHTGRTSGIYGMSSLDWRQIEKDLSAMMRKAEGMRKKENLIDAALIAGYVLTTTCKEFAWLLQHIKGVMGLSSVVDGVIKDGIRKLIAEHPDKVYMRNYLGTVL